MFRYDKYLSHLHSCCWDLVLALPVAMVNTPVHHKQSHFLDIHSLYYIENSWTTPEISFCSRTTEDVSLSDT